MTQIKERPYGTQDFPVFQKDITLDVNVLQEVIRRKDMEDFDDWTDPQLRAELISRQDFTIKEQVTNSQLQAGVVVGIFGDHIPTSHLAQRIDEHLVFMKENYDMEPNGVDLVGHTGFEGSYWTRSVTKQELLPLQVALGETMVYVALDQMGLKPENIGRIKNFKVAATVPASILLAKYIAEITGMAPDTKIELVSHACNSFASAINDQIEETKDDPDALSLTIGVETMMALRVHLSPEWQGTTNRPALAFFSDGAAAFIGNLSRFKKRIEVAHEAPDTDGVISGINTIPPFGDKISELVHRSHFVNMNILPVPKNAQTITMNPSETAKFFIRFINDMVQKFKNTPQAVDWLSRATHGFGHRPSMLLRSKYLRLLEDAGMPKGIFLDWSGEYGNGPCIIWGHEMAKLLPQLQDGDVVVGVFFGAGATGQTNIYEIAPLQEKD